MKEKNNICDICNGGKKNQDCPYCNGTGEWNQAGASYLKNHICECINLDRKWCPVCNEPCHHDTTLNPKCTIDDGFGGVAKSIEKPKEVEEIIA